MIGIQFGAFNPIHKEHINNLKRIKKHFKDIKLFISPVSNQYLEKRKNVKNIIDIKNRIKMYQIALKDTDIKLLDYEMKQDKIMYTYDILKYYANEYFKSKKIILIMGDDNLKSLRKWKNIDKYFNLCWIMFFPRLHLNKCLLVKSFEEYLKIKINDDVSNNVSSSLIKKDIDKWKNYLDDNVYLFIKENELY